MRKKIVILFCAFIIAILISCEPPYRKKSPDDSSRRTYKIANANYDISLISVERSNGTKKIYGEQRIEAVIEEGISTFFFEDETVKIKWFPTPNDIVIVVNNKADRPVRIVWDEARFIDEKDESHRLIHSGIGYEERNESHPPTVVEARGTLEDFMHPADYFRWEEAYGGKSSKQQGYWRRASFLPTQIKGTAEELRAKTEPFVGKTFQVILALQIENVRNDYVNTFRINKVEVTEKVQQEPQPEKNHDEGKGSEKGSRRRTF